MTATASHIPDADRSDPTDLTRWTAIRLARATGEGSPSSGDIVEAQLERIGAPYTRPT